MKGIRRWLLTWLHPALVWVGQQHLPFTRKLLTGRHYYDLFPRLRAGMILCTQTKGELSNVLIPGHFTHVGIYIGGGFVMEATGRGVVKTDLITFLLSKDHVRVRSPKFASRTEMESAAVWARNQEGKPYDWLFTPSPKALYCAELGIRSYWRDTSKECPFPPRDFLGVPAWSPDDIANADKLWSTEWDSQTALVTP